MPNFTHEQLAILSKPASNTEEQKLQNALSTVRNALDSSNLKLTRPYEIFGQGSYANNTNVRNNSDVDLNICYHDIFYFDTLPNTTLESHGISLSADNYTFSQYKDDIEKILVEYYGRSNVQRKNKCIHIKDNTYHSEIDVVPTWEFRDYRNKFSPTNYIEGVCLFSDSGSRIINYPKQHLSNGIDKNKVTKLRFKSLVRIIKNLHIKMEEDNYYLNENITSFLIESLTYNFPNIKFLLGYDRYDWNDILNDYITYFWNKTSEDNKEWESFTEVSNLLYLMYGHKWNKNDVHTFMYYLWNYLGY